MDPLFFGSIFALLLRRFCAVSFTVFIAYARHLRIKFKKLIKKCKIKFLRQNVIIIYEKAALYVKRLLI